MNIDKTLKDKKVELLSYFRDRSGEFLTGIKTKYADTQADKRARAINESINQSKATLIATLLQQAEKEKWTSKEKLECILMITYVRAEENNSYFNTLKNSKIWEAYSGNDAYLKIKEYSGYDLKLWIETNINWMGDFNAETMNHFKGNHLLQYLLW